MNKDALIRCRLLERIAAEGVSYERAAATFVDLSGLHELGHYLAFQYGIDTPSRWLHELMATYFGYGFLVDKQPDLQRILESARHRGLSGGSESCLPLVVRLQCGNQTCSVRVEVSSQFFNVTSGNIVRIHVKSDGNPFPSTGFDVDGGINRPVATLTTAAHLKTGLSPGSHSVTVEFDMRSPGGTAEAGIRTVMIQVFTP